MKNVEVELYMNQFITFFEKNPNDLLDLIGDSEKDLFYDKVRQRCIKNHKNGDDITLTNRQIMEIILEMKNGEIPHKVHKLFEKTKYGYFGLN
jgi:hypothetical protein